MTDGRRLLLTLLSAVWALAFVYAFAAFWTTVPTGEGFVRGTNRVVSYLGWQGIAGMLAVAIWGIGRGWPPGASTRRLSAVPIALALLHVAAIGFVIVWARFG